MVKSKFTFKKNWKSKLPYESVLSHITDIEERNKAFHKLSQPKQNMEIALDALELLGKGVMKDQRATGGFGYWSQIKSPKTYNFRLIGLDSEELQQILLSIKKCSVCERGAYMLSRVRLGNEIDTNTEDKYDDASRGSANLCGDKTFQNLLKMENEYEQNKYDHPYKTQSNKKMANIFLNMIFNKGFFKTTDDTDYLKSILSKS